MHHRLWQPLASGELNLLLDERESDEYECQSSELKQAWQAGIVGKAEKFQGHSPNTALKGFRDSPCGGQPGKRDDSVKKIALTDCVRSKKYGQGGHCDRVDVYERFETTDS